MNPFCQGRIMAFERIVAIGCLRTQFLNATIKFNLKYNCYLVFIKVITALWYQSKSPQHGVCLVFTIFLRWYLFKSSFPPKECINYQNMKKNFFQNFFIFWEKHIPYIYLILKCKLQSRNFWIFGDRESFNKDTFKQHLLSKVGEYIVIYPISQNQVNPSSISRDMWQNTFNTK